MHSLRTVDLKRTEVTAHTLVNDSEFCNFTELKKIRKDSLDTFFWLEFFLHVERNRISLKINFLILIFFNVFTLIQKIREIFF